MKKTMSGLMTMAALGAAVLTGCVTPSRYVDENNTEHAVKNVQSMSSSDWVVATNAAAQSLLTSPLFQEFLTEYANQARIRWAADSANQGKVMPARLARPVLMLNYIQNNTGEHIDTKLLTERLREILFNSGRVRFTTYVAGTEQIADTATGYAREMASDPNVNQQTVKKQGKVNAYDLSLNGVIIKQSARARGAQEVSFTFSLTLTDNDTGEGVWAYTKEVKRQQGRNTVGW